MLKLLGVTAVPVAARGVQAADATGFGDGGYGDGGYGGSSNGAEPIEPVVTTEAPGEITASAATFRGELVDLDGAKTVSVFFSWRKSGADSWRTTPAHDLDSGDRSAHPSRPSRVTPPTKFVRSPTLTTAQCSAITAHLRP